MRTNVPRNASASNTENSCNAGYSHETVLQPEPQQGPGHLMGQSSSF